MARTPADKNFSTRIPVLIKVEMTTSTPRVIWAHEKPLLEELHGEDNVIDVPLEKIDEGYVDKIAPNLLTYNKTQDRIQRPSDTLGIGFVFIGEPEAEYSRLVDAYGRHPEINMSLVEKVYGRLQAGAFTQLLKKPRLQDLPDQQLRSLIAEFGYPGDINKDATVDEKKEHADKVRGLRVMSSDDLLKLAGDIGVQI